MAELIEMEIKTREKLNNLDVLHLVSLLDAMIRQCAACGSATQFESHPEDLNTMQGLWAHFNEQFLTHANAPVLWMPNYNPEPLQVSIPPKIYRVENPTLQHNLDLMAALRTQLIFSTSADKVAGFETREVEAVLVPVIAKCTQYIDGAIKDLANPTHHYIPDVNDQVQPGPNPGYPS